MTDVLPFAAMVPLSGNNGTQALITVSGCCMRLRGFYVSVDPLTSPTGPMQVSLAGLVTNGVATGFGVSVFRLYINPSATDSTDLRMDFGDRGITCGADPDTFTFGWNGAGSDAPTGHINFWGEYFLAS